MKSIFIMAVLLVTATATQAQIKNAQTATVKVYGNCGMCETTIEKAGSKAKTSKTDWNEETGMAVITYDAKKTSLDAVLKNIALVGYDNANHLAPNEVYDKLHGCCKYDREKKTDAVPAAGNPHHQAAQGHGADAAAVLSASKLSEIYNQYFSLKDALVATDAAAASASAASLLAALNVVDMQKLQSKEHDSWMKVQQNLKEDAGKIKSSQDISQQRTFFSSLSTNMYDLIKVASPGQSVYLQFCPMASQGKGASWLSKEKTVKNPYYGSQMLSCGKTVETIQ